MTRIFTLDDAGSFAWIAHPDESMQRASSAVVTSIGTLVIDPVDFGGLDNTLSRLGPVAGIVQLLDRCDEFTSRRRRVQSGVVVSNPTSRATIRHP